MLKKNSKVGLIIHRKFLFNNTTSHIEQHNKEQPWLAMSKQQKGLQKKYIYI